MRLPSCIFYEMVTLQHPFNGRNIYELMKSICSGLYAPLPPPYGCVGRPSDEVF